MSKVHTNTKYNPKWEETYTFLKPGSNENTARCTYCSTEFRIGNQGVSQVKSYEKGKKHVEKAQIINGKSKQTTIQASTGTLKTTIESKTAEMSMANKILNAEIYQALKFADGNYSFASASDDSSRFKLMFPDSDIAKGYRQSATKLKYVIVHGIAPFFKESDKK